MTENQNAILYTNHIVELASIFKQLLFQTLKISIQDTFEIVYKQSLPHSQRSVKGIRQLLYFLNYRKKKK